VNEGIGLSGVITSGTRFDAFLADLFRHCDAYLVSGVDGKFGVRLVRGPAGDEPTLDESRSPDIGAVGNVRFFSRRSVARNRGQPIYSFVFCLTWVADAG
jgi:hypothetical protein